MTRNVLIIPGDGIGIEVMAEARRIVEWLNAHRGTAITLTEGEMGTEVWRRTGVPMSDETIEAAKSADAVLFGAVGGDEIIPRPIRRARGLLALRRAMGLYANLRPVKAYEALLDATSLKERVARGVDLVVLRELSSGVYFGEPRFTETLPSGKRRAVDTQVYTEEEIERIARDAFLLARTRRGQVASVEKSNVMETGRLWRDVVTALHAAEFQDVALRHVLSDNFAMQIIRDPRQFDVVVTDNLFGDLLSDASAMIAGSLGMLPSASLGTADASGRRPALYEPVHGSAPDIAGKGIANPIAAILSVAMMLRHSFGLTADAELVEKAVEAALDGGARTADLYVQGGIQPVTTAGMTKAIMEKLEALAV
ncbi:3-isopropylmalate dehydrogenase [Stella humosa]|uniref:3-isopropylmalate dehydrogenase n=1 Tax=Stella humosa TaxID=94 RepID=A0A3N1MLC4_9PROT|nr:3-isopropylmalate dehydrogenase [Stella humosa]ROQ01796.1 3-isopropylmalate dehydrogenase [Stella humosa]BBK32182.1 3-isopropylmalate dehydrogenase 1 [Stella humosa]